jgi:hypothetical protein
MKSNQSTSKCVQHTLDNRYTYGTIQDTMDILRITKRGRIMNTLGRYHIYKSIKMKGNVSNDTHAKNENPILEIIYKYEK